MKNITLSMQNQAMHSRALSCLSRPLSKGLICLALLCINTAQAAQPLENGNFETADLSAWSTASTNNAQVRVVAKNSCFSSQDTTAINIRGSHAALLRSNAQGDKNAQAVLTSNSFIAGDGIAFIALSESNFSLGGKEPTRLVVEIVDADDDADDDTILAEQTFTTGQAQLQAGCPSDGADGTDGAFSSHYFSTRAFTGDNIKIRFKQNTRIKGNGFFTLIDQVVLFNQHEQPAFSSRPHAQAGMKLSSWGTPMLSSKGSFDANKSLFDLAYTWYLNDGSDDVKILPLRNPCLADLENGNYSATLYVNDGHHAISDEIEFFINEETQTSSSSADEESAESGEISVENNNLLPIVATDPECDVEIALLEDVNSPIVEVNDPNNLFVDTSKFDVVDNLTTPTESNNNQEYTSTILTKDAYDLRTSGIVWKPVSEGDGKLVVLTPAHFSLQTVSLHTASGRKIETANSVGRTNGNRATYRFDRPGASYPSNIILRVGNTDYLVNNPAQRTN